jgi:hypothetical protein
VSLSGALTARQQACYVDENMKNLFLPLVSFVKQTEPALAAALAAAGAPGAAAAAAPSPDELRGRIDTRACGRTERRS